MGEGRDFQWRLWVLEAVGPQAGVGFWIVLESWMKMGTFFLGEKAL